MARMDMRKPIDVLIQEKNSIDAKLNDIQNRFEVKHKRLTDLRQDQFSFREGKSTLSNSASNNPAKRVFDSQIATAQRQIDEVSTELESLEKERVVYSTKAQALQKSIKELQNS